MLPWLVGATDVVAASGGGSICSPLGDCKLKVDVTYGGKLMSLHRGEQAVGLAMLAWREGLEDFLWEELVRAWNRFIRDANHYRSERPEFRRPPLPWFAVILFPSFLRGADVRDLCNAESIFWAAAHSLLTLESKSACNVEHTSS